MVSIVLGSVVAVGCCWSSCVSLNGFAYHGPNCREYVDPMVSPYILSGMVAIHS